MARRKGKDSLSKKFKRFKIKAVIIALSASISILSIVLIVTMISNLVSSTVAAISAINSKYTILYCDGTYKNKSCDLHIWSEDINLSDNQGVLAFAEKYANDNSYKYRSWVETNKSTHQCPLCHPESNKHAQKGWNCRGFVAACYYHGGGVKTINCWCKGFGIICGKVSDFSLSNWEKENGKGWERIYNGGKDLKKSQLQDGDIIFWFNDGAAKNEMSHVALVTDAKNGLVADSTSGGGIQYNKPVHSFGKVGFRYKGSLSGGNNTDEPTSSSPMIDFKVSASNKFAGNRYQLFKKDISVGGQVGDLNASLILDESNGRFEITGTLCGSSLSLNGTAVDGKINGEGLFYNVIDTSQLGDIKLTGAEAKATTPMQLKIAQIAAGYNNPYYNGWHGLCEGWVCDVYRKAGLHYNGSCCANRSKLKYAGSSAGKTIPVGAAIYSGSSYKSSCICECGLNAGHVAIYIGGNKVAGSQSPYIMTLQNWTNIFGYGGWYLPSN